MVTQVRPAGTSNGHDLLRHTGYIAAALAMLALSGCSTLDLFGDVDESEARDETAATFDPEAGAPKSPGQTKDASPRAKPRPPTATPTPETAKAPAADLDPDKIVGLNEVDAERLFGAPHFVIR